VQIISSPSSPSFTVVMSAFILWPMICFNPFTQEVKVWDYLIQGLAVDFDTWSRDPTG